MLKILNLILLIFSAVPPRDKYYLFPVLKRDSFSHDAFGLHGTTSNSSHIALYDWLKHFRI